MAPTILVVGSTGNTGQSVMHLLPKLLDSSKTMKSHRILGLTRNKNSETAKKLSQIPHVEMAEHDWTNTDVEWFKDNEIVRVFVASFNTMSAFAIEAQFLNNARIAGVKYVVRISTTTQNVAPDTPVYYGRTHWAIETMLSQPEFQSMQWTSLQPMGFTNMYFSTAASWLSNYRKTGKQEPLNMMADEHAPAAVVDPSDVGELAAHLLAQDDPTKYNHGKLTVNGPEDITGRQIVEELESRIGEKIQKVNYRNLDFLEYLRQDPDMSEQSVKSIANAPVATWEGRTSTKSAPTSKEVIELAPPQHGAFEELRKTLDAA